MADQNRAPRTANAWGAGPPKSLSSSSAPAAAAAASTASAASAASSTNNNNSSARVEQQQPQQQQPQQPQPQQQFPYHPQYHHNQQQPFQQYYHPHPHHHHHQQPPPQFQQPQFQQHPHYRPQYLPQQAYHQPPHYANQHQFPQQPQQPPQQQQPQQPPPQQPPQQAAPTAGNPAPSEPTDRAGFAASLIEELEDANFSNDSFLEHAVQASMVDMLDHRVLCTLRDGKILIGDLRSFDQWGNMILEDCIQREVFESKFYADTYRGVFIIRGENIVLIGCYDELVEDEQGLMKKVSSSELQQMIKSAKTSGSAHSASASLAHIDEFD